MADARILSAQVVVHGGPDEWGVPEHDFSTNSNACGPCPLAMQAVREADALHYPDPSYTELRARLAQWHGVSSERVVLAGSGSEWIRRFTAWVRLQAAHAHAQPPHIHWPAHAYGDYADAAQVWGLPHTSVRAQATLLWACEPSSPMGQTDVSWLDTVHHLHAHQHVVLDLAYAPLRLSGQPCLESAPMRDRVWQMWTPNKALGMTGVRGAYAIAPLNQENAVHELQALAPSWVLGGHAVAMLTAWTQHEVQHWLQMARETLRVWKAQQVALCESLGWQIAPSEANYFCAQLPQPLSGVQWQRLRARGVKLRDATSFGLPGWVRVGVLPPTSQDALARAWQEVGA